MRQSEAELDMTLGGSSIKRTNITTLRFQQTTKRDAELKKKKKN